MAAMIMQKMRLRYGGEDVRDALQVLLVLGAVLALRVAYVLWFTPYGLAPDEAQYWTWLRHNDLSFVTKPPLTTWLMGLSTLLLGQTLLGVKVFALVGQSVVAGLGFMMARELGGRVSGWWVLALLVTVPLVAAGGLLMSPDAVLLPLWMGALYAVMRGVGKEDVQALCWGRWLLVGVLVGLAGLAKYSAVLFAPLLGVFMLLYRPRWLLAPQVWVAGVVALLMQAPVIYWNIMHGWVGLEHVLWQTDGGGDTRHGGWKSLGEFVASQVLVLGPVGLVVMVGGWWMAVKGSVQARFLLWMTLPIALGFMAMTMYGKVQANWPLLGTVPVLVLGAVWAARVRGWGRWLLVAGVVVNGVLSGMLMNTYAARDWGLLPLKDKAMPTKDLMGWQEMGDLVRLLLQQTDNPVLMMSRYQTLAPLVFHSGFMGDVAYVNAEGRRMTEYDLWPLPQMSDRLVVYVNEQGILPEGVRARFGACAPWHKLAVENYGVQVRTLGMFICWGWRG